MPKPCFKLNTFSASEAEYVTGISKGMQRVWRQRGHLPAVEGHARFNIFDLAEMYALAAFTHLRLGPEFSQKFARQLGDSIAYRALQVIPSYQNWSDDLSDANIHNEICVAFGRLAHPEKFFVIWHDETAEFTDDLNATFDWKMDDTRKIALKQGAPALVLNVDQIGVQFAPWERSSSDPPMPAVAFRPFVRLLQEGEG